MRRQCRGRFVSERFAATTSTRLVRVTAGYGQIPGDRQSDGSTQPAWPRHGCDRGQVRDRTPTCTGPMWLLESADRSRVRVVVASKTLRNVWLRSADQMNVPCGTLLTASTRQPRRIMQTEAINKEGRHVGLDFYDFLI